MTKVSFYKTAGGNEVVLDFIRSLPREDKLRLGEDLRFVELAHPVGPPLCRPLRDGMWEIRSSLPSRREMRLICCHDGKTQKIIVLHAFVKKTQRTPASELRLARQRKDEFIRRE